MNQALPATAALPVPTRPRRWPRRLGGGLLALAAVLVAGGVALFAVDTPVPLGPEPAGLADPLPAAHPPAGLAFSVLQTGVSDGAAEALIVGRGRWTVHRRPSQSAVLVRHPSGLLLFDSGLGRQVDAQFAANAWRHRVMFGYQRAGHLPVVDQLERAGWDPKQVRAIIPSHMHWDHVSGLADFPDAEVWVTPQEREGATHGHAPAFLASQFAGVTRWHDVRFDGPARLGFPASHDVFGDGSVVLLPMGGHTAGQTGLLLRLPSGATYLFTGDVTWTVEGVTQASDRSWLLRHLLPLDHDEAANRAVIAHLHQLSRRHPGIRIVPAHDENVLETLPKFPALSP
jgi:glyoxylase-like metal-dependent hydrolase (beta-lactamase superfamily II)